MKKIISCVAVAMTIASASAQITVSSNGQALFGKTTSTPLVVYPSTPANDMQRIVNGNTVVVDTTAEQYS